MPVSELFHWLSCTTSTISGPGNRAHNYRQNRASKWWISLFDWNLSIFVTGGASSSGGARCLRFRRRGSLFAWRCSGFIQDSGRRIGGRDWDDLRGVLGFLRRLVKSDLCKVTILWRLWVGYWLVFIFWVPAKPTDSCRPSIPNPQSNSRPSAPS